MLTQSSILWMTGMLGVCCTAILEVRRRASLSEFELMRARIDRAQRTAELECARRQLLHAQAQPHFLFNTLANIRRLAQTDRHAAAAMIDRFMCYVTAALPSLDRDDLALSDERVLLDSYLQIHQMRMGDRLRYRIEIPEELLEIRVPSMMLLTLVENAIKHGLRELAQGGSIKVSARQGPSGLELSVSDTGLGLTHSVAGGTGLANIRARLALTYGGRARLSLAPGMPRGLIATIRIPL